MTHNDRHKTLFNPPTRNFDSQQVALMWRQFVSANSTTLTGVRDVISASWQRCHESGVDAHNTRANFVGRAELQNRRLANRLLIDAAAHSWQLLSASMIASESIFVLTDAHGVMLETRGSEEIVEAAAHQGVAPGFDWSEESAGTNAVGTALRADTPTIVRSDEHFCAAAKIWDCASAIIRDPSDGKTLGVLNVTSVGDLSDNQTLALAITAAKQIENTLHSSELAYSIQLLHWFRHQLIREPTQDGVLLDGRARVITTTRSLSEQDIPPFEIVAGQPVCSQQSGAKIVRVIEYEWPADLASANPNRGWSGGIVLIDAIKPKVEKVSSEQSSQAYPPSTFRKILTRDNTTKGVIKRAHRMAQTSAPVLISGETGSGKELFARAIHDASPLSSGPFVAVNCGVFTRELAASELFGYEKGAFTGASPQGRIGKFEEADGGTLFLDEIGELPLDVQVHLLRVLQDNVVVRIGGNKEQTVNVRVIAATNRDLAQESKIGMFRTDLFFRLNVLNLPIPPLRNRSCDVELLGNHHLRELQGRYGLGSNLLSAELINALRNYPWPGNVRELFALIESMYVLTDRTEMSIDDLPGEFVETDHEPAVNGSQQLKLRELEKDSIETAIYECRHNMSKAAARLGISRSTLYRKIRALNIAT